MGKINDLIAENKLADAASILYDALYCVLNSTPNFTISRSEFALVAPELVKKLQNPVEEEKEKTDAPGDDIEVIEKTALLTITYDAPDGFPGPATSVKKILVGSEYKITAPAFDGYTVEPEVITGTMTADGASATLTYTAIEEDEEEEEETEETYDVVINYEGPDDDFFAESFEDIFDAGSTVVVDVPVVEGYDVDPESITVEEGTPGSYDTETGKYTITNLAADTTVTIAYIASL